MLPISVELLQAVAEGVKLAATMPPRFSAGALARNAATPFKPLPSVAHLSPGGSAVRSAEKETLQKLRRHTTEPAPKRVFPDPVTTLTPADIAAIDRGKHKKQAASSMVIHGVRIGARYAKKKRFPGEAIKKVAAALLADKLANVTSARAQLAQGMKRSKLKVTTGGPSVQQLAKPMGFGHAIAGATKGVV